MSVLTFGDHLFLNKSKNNPLLNDRITAQPQPTELVGLYARSLENLGAKFRAKAKNLLGVQTEIDVIKRRMNTMILEAE